MDTRRHPQGRVEARLLPSITVACCHAGKSTSCLMMLLISWLRSKVLCAALHALTTDATAIHASGGHVSESQAIRDAGLALSMLSE